MIHQSQTLRALLPGDTGAEGGQKTALAEIDASCRVPVLFFFTGAHADYHRPTDTADKIEYAGLDRIVDFAAAIVRRVDRLEQAPPFVKVEPQARPGGRDGIRITTGTIPD